jgi:hypothetical protein
VLKFDVYAVNNEENYDIFSFIKLEGKSRVHGSLFEQAHYAVILQSFCVLRSITLH